LCDELEAVGGFASSLFELNGFDLGHDCGCVD
jgi:hypothetical protein